MYHWEGGGSTSSIPRSTRSPTTTPTQTAVNGNDELSEYLIPDDTESMDTPPRSPNPNQTHSTDDTISSTVPVTVTTFYDPISTGGDETQPQEHQNCPNRRRPRCNGERLEAMEPLFLRADSAVDNGTMGMTPQPSPSPNPSRNFVAGIRYKNLGKSGLRVSNLGLATWMLSTESPETLENIVTLAYDSGINMFDLSEAYSGPTAEIELGKILKKRGWKRSSYVITTKIYWTTKCEERGLSRKYIIDCVKSSLERLQLDFIDVVIIHRVDSTCPMEEIVRTMNHVINHGWAMYWGTSKWTPVEIMEAYSNCRQFNCIMPIVEQAEYHFFCRDKAELYMTELYNKIGVGLMTWSPLTMSFSKVFGKHADEAFAFSFRSSFKKKYSSSYSWGDEDRDSAGKETWVRERSISAEEGTTHKQLHQQRATKELSHMAEKYGFSLSQLSIAWCLKLNDIQSMLVGPSSTHELLLYLQALQLVPKLTSGIVSDLEKILDNKPTRPPMISTLALGTPR